MKKVLALVLSLAMCAGMLLAFTFTSNADPVTEFKTDKVDNTGNWVAAVTMTYPADAEVSTWNEVRVGDDNGAKTILGLRFRNKPAQTKWQFELQSQTASGTWTPEPRVSKEYTYTAQDVNTNVLHVILYKTETAINMELVVGQKVALEIELNGELLGTTDFASYLTDFAFAGFKGKAENSAVVEMSNAYIGDNAGTEWHPEFNGANGFEINFDVIMSFDAYTNYGSRLDTGRWYAMGATKGETYGEFLGGWMSVIPERSQLLYKYQLNNAYVTPGNGGWASEVTGDWLSIPGNIFKVNYKREAGSGDLVVTVKNISGETIKTITFNEALDAGTSFGDALDQMLKLHLDPGKNNDANVNSYYANCEVILPEVTTTATATTTPSATPTPTPTPTTGDAMLAVVALAVVAMAGTAIVSKKRR